MSVLFYCCPHCLPPTLGGQAGNKRQDRHTNRVVSSRRMPQYAAKKKKIPRLMNGVTFHFIIFNNKQGWNEKGRRGQGRRVELPFNVRQLLAAACKNYCYHVPQGVTYLLFQHSIFCHNLPFRQFSHHLLHRVQEFLF